MWDVLPKPVKLAVESAAGGRVVEALTQPTGFSPGVAARLRLADGRRAFVKAMPIDLHPPSAHLYRLEAAAMERLPVALPAPALLGRYDSSGWIALTYEDVDGSHPEVPWRDDQLAQVGAALTDLADLLRSSPWLDAPTFAQLNEGILAAPTELLAAPPPDLDGRLRRHLEGPAGVESAVGVAVAVLGDSLLHTDLRWDNILIRADGRVVFLDWSWACRGASWLDVVCFAISLNTDGGPDAERFVQTHPVTAGIDPRAIDSVLVAIAANYWRGSRGPNAAQHCIPIAEGLLRWLDRRLPAG